MARILVTRPKIEAMGTLQALLALGHQPVLQPMMTIETLTFPIPDATKTLIITSKNGARSGLANLPDVGMKIFAVGQATADIVNEMGFENLVTATGSVKSLMPILFAYGQENDAEFVHLSGEDISYDIVGALHEKGHPAVRTVTYAARKADAMDDDVQDALKRSLLDGVIFYSARSATIFEELIADYNGNHWLTSLDAYVISNRVAKAMMGPWGSVQTAPNLSESALIDLIK